MSEPTDSKEPEPVRLPPDPPMDMRHENDRSTDESEIIRAKEWVWATNTKPHDEPGETASESEQANEPQQDD